MRTRNRFLVGAVSALITFGTLMAVAGPRRMHHHRSQDCSHECQQEQGPQQQELQNQSH